MEILQEITSKAIETLKKRATSIQRFKLPIEEHAVCVLLKAAYLAEVKKRGADIVPDAVTEENLRKVSRWLVSGIKPGLMLFGGVGNGK